jgi:hypothetical protein
MFLRDESFFNRNSWEVLTKDSLSANQDTAHWLINSFLRGSNQRLIDYVLDFKKIYLSEPAVNVLLERQEDLGGEVLFRLLKLDKLSIVKAVELFGFYPEGKPLGLLHYQGNVFIPDPIVRFVSLGCPSKETWSDFDNFGVFVQFDPNIHEIEPFCNLIKMLYFDSVDANLLDLYNDSNVVKKHLMLVDT